MKKENNLFPIFLKLDKLHTLIVGGGNVALEKLRALLRNDPDSRITLVASSFRTEILDIAIVTPRINIITRDVIPNDFQGINLALLATNNKDLHSRAKNWACKKNVMVNVADTPDLCDFYLGSTVKKGDLKIGISTNGKSPTFSKRIREFLETSLPNETHELLQNLEKIREKLSCNFAYKVKKLNEVTKSLNIT